jgi:ribonuclease BN (tRNA processing enzyme)
MAALAVALSFPTAAVAQPVCPTLRWTTLGTAGGPVPTPERSEPANLLVAGDQTILIDVGDGTVDQLARVGVDLGKVSAVFISHHHQDHVGGLFAVIGLRWMNQYPGQLVVYGPPGTRQVVDGLVAALGPQARVGFGLGAADRPPADSVRVVEFRGGDSVKLGELSVSVAANSHFDHPGEHHTDDPQSLSMRFTLGNRSITYTGDTGPSRSLSALAKGSDLLVSEVIDLDRLVGEIRARRADASPLMLEQMERHLSSHHLIAREVGRLAADAGVGRVLLTHFAVPPGPIEHSEPALRSGIAAAYAGPVDLGRDLASFAVACRP